MLLRWYNRFVLRGGFMEMLGMIKSYDVKDEINKIILEKGIKEDDIICSKLYFNNMR